MRPADYDPLRYTRDGLVLEALDKRLGADPVARMGFAELLNGNLGLHEFYVVPNGRNSDPTARPAPEALLVPRARDHVRLMLQNLEDTIEKAIGNRPPELPPLSGPVPMIHLEKIGGATYRWTKFRGPPNLFLAAAQGSSRFRAGQVLLARLRKWLSSRTCALVSPPTEVARARALSSRKVRSLLAVCRFVNHLLL